MTMVELTPSTPEPSDAITEKFSKNTPPRKRGRPPKLPAWERALSRQGSEGKSARCRNNILYQTRVVSWAADDPRFEWLSSDSATILQGRGHMRSTILAELGRIEDEHDREALALYLCAHQPTARQAIALLRQYRLGTCPRGSAAQLTDILRRTVATYQAEHTGLTDDEVYQALHDVAHEILVQQRE
jgi:hypothetical protein